jgi:hypothetical protein
MAKGPMRQRWWRGLSLAAAIVVGGATLSSCDAVSAERNDRPAGREAPSSTAPSIAPLPSQTDASISPSPSPSPSDPTSLLVAPSTAPAVKPPVLSGGARPRTDSPLLGRISGYRANATRLAAMTVQLYAPGADLDSATPLQVATVTATGEFQFGAVPAGPYQFVVRYEGSVVDHRELTAGRLPTRVVNVRLGAIDQQSRDADLSGDGLPDLVARDPAGVVWVYTGDGRSGLNGRYAIASGWGSMTALVRPGDWDKDGFADLIARDAAGTMWVYPGDGEGGLLARQQLTTGWGHYLSITAVSGYQFEENACLFTLDPDRHNIWVFCRDGLGNFNGERRPEWVYGEVYSYQTVSTVAGAGDFVGLGRPGFFYKTSWPAPTGGWEYMAYAKIGPYWYHPLLYGSPWIDYVSMTGAGDLDGNLRDDLVALDPWGQLWLVRSSGSVYDPGSVSVYRTPLASGWNGYTLFR